MLEPARQHRVDLGAVDIDAKDVVELDEHAAWLHVRLRRPRLELMPQRVVPAEIAEIHSDSVASAFRRKESVASAFRRKESVASAFRRKILYPEDRKVIRQYDRNRTSSAIPRLCNAQNRGTDIPPDRRRDRRGPDCRRRTRQSTRVPRHCASPALNRSAATNARHTLARSSSPNTASSV